MPNQLSQSSFIFGSLFVAFLVYITAKGELPTYIKLLTTGDQSAAPVASADPTQAGTPAAAPATNLTDAQRQAAVLYGTVPQSFLGAFSGSPTIFTDKGAVTPYIGAPVMTPLGPK